jgi:hypothetical protein
MSSDAEQPGRDQLKKTIWEGYVDADFRAVYFSEYTDRLRRRVRWISIAIGVLSCGPLAAALSQSGMMWMFAWLGVAAAVLGVYLTADGLPRKLATSTAAAQAWNAVARERGEMWRRLRAGESVDINQFWMQDRDLSRVDDAVLQDLPEDELLSRRAQEKSERSLGIAA